MMNLLKMSSDWALQYNDEGLHIIIMLLALIYIWQHKKENYHRYLFLGYCGIFTVVYFCPLSSWVITKFIGDLVYWRVLWLLPLPVIIAYVMVKVWYRTEEKWKRAGCLGIFAAALILTGQFIYLDHSPYEERTNWAKIPSSPVAICDLINANREEGEWVLLAAPEDMVPYIRMEDASINQVYGRKGNYWSGGKVIMKILDDEQIDYDTLCTQAKEIRCNFIVLPDGAGRVEGMAIYDFDVIGRVGSYVVYKDMNFTPES